MATDNRERTERRDEIIPLTQENPEDTEEIIEQGQDIQDIQDTEHTEHTEHTQHTSVIVTPPISAGSTHHLNPRRPHSTYPQHPSIAQRQAYYESSSALPSPRAHLSTISPKWPSILLMSAFFANGIAAAALFIVWRLTECQ